MESQSIFILYLTMHNHVSLFAFSHVHVPAVCKLFGTVHIFGVTTQCVENRRIQVSVNNLFEQKFIVPLLFCGISCFGLMEKAGEQVPNRLAWCRCKKKTHFKEEAWVTCVILEPCFSFSLFFSNFSSSLFHCTNLYFSLTWDGMDTSLLSNSPLQLQLAFEALLLSLYWSLFFHAGTIGVQ